MSKRDFYDVLGVSRNATADELKKAYRTLAKKYHPDQNQGDKEAEQRFKELNEAYDVLKDEQSRAAYDQFGHAAFDGGMGGPRGAAPEPLQTSQATEPGTRICAFLPSKASSSVISIL